MEHSVDDWSSRMKGPADN